MPGDLDPDVRLSVPLRDVAATLALLDVLIDQMDDEAQAAPGSDALLALGKRLHAGWAGARFDAVSVLPEVGPVDDDEGFRLFLHRLRQRLATTSPQALTDLPAPPVTRPVHADIPIRRVSRSAAVIDDELADSFVWWDDITAEDVSAYEMALNEAPGERAMQQYLANHPVLLVQHRGGGHGRWVIPQKRLGSEYVTDFVIGEKDSGGKLWEFVELQDPKARLFVPSSRRLSDQFDEGLRQILDWRRWLESNLDYARRPRVHDGLGLTNVNSRDGGLIIIGREHTLSEEDKVRRKQLGLDHNIRIHTYDWLVRRAKSRIASLEQRA